MWHNLFLLRGIASILFFLSAVVLLYAGIHRVVTQPDLLPLQRVKLLSEPKNIDVTQLERFLETRINGNFFTVDIEKLRLELESAAWVRSARVRRVFPDGLAVELEEHQMYARWNQTELVNIYGEVFGGKSDVELPEFEGQQGTSTMMKNRFDEFNQILNGLDMEVSRLVLSPRHSWRLHLNNNMVLELGRNGLQQRLRRFVDAYPHAQLEIENKGKDTGLITVDLRYKNGFAVRQSKSDSKG